MNVLRFLRPSLWKIENPLLTARGTVENLIDIFASDPADSDNEHANKDYSSVAANFEIAPPSNEKWQIARLLVFIQDTAPMDADRYGNNIVLTNGIILKTFRGATEKVNLTNDQPIKTNSQWGKFCYNTTLSTYGVGEENLAVRWTFLRAGSCIGLDGSKGDKIVITLNDDFSGLSEHTFLFEGFKDT